MTIDVIGERLPHPLEHVARLFLSPTKIWVQPLSHTPQRSMLVVVTLLLIFVGHFFVVVFVARTLVVNMLVGRNIVHRRAGEHSFRARNVAAVRADMNRADRLTVHFMQSHDPRWVAMRIRAEGVAGRFKTHSGLVCDVAGDLKRAARIQIQPRSVDRRAFGRSDD